MSQQSKIIYAFFSLIVLGLSYIAFIVWDVSQVRPAAVTILDVGQGDAILIQTPGHRTVLIDGGPDNAVLYRLGAHVPYYGRSIDLLVLTHPDNDHVAGLPEVVRRYAVGAALITGVNHRNAAYDTLKQYLADRNIPVIIAGTLSAIQIDDQSSLTILYPPQPVSNQTFKEINDTSIVSRFTVGDFSILLTGDSTKKIEAELLASSAPLGATVLKVGHHGSDTSSGEPFLRAVAPTLAVISSGRGNRFGHPHPKVLQRLTNLQIPVLDTQAAGEITLYFDSTGLRISTAGAAVLEK